jgi:MFS family permease
VGEVVSRRSALAQGRPQKQDEEQGDGFRFLLGRRNFRRVWFAQIAAQLADKFLMFSLIILAYHLGHASTPVAITLLAYTVPAVAIAPLAGVFADRHDRKTIMIWTNAVRGLLIALIPLSSMVPALRGDYLHLLAITFAFAAVGQLFSPAEAAAIPSLIPRSALLTANSMVLGTMVFTLVLGGAAAPVVSRLDIYAPYWLATGLFCIAAVLVWAAGIPHNEPHLATDRHPFHQVAVEIKDGIDSLRTSPVLLVSFLELSLAVLVMFMMFTLAPAYVSRILGETAEDSYLILVPATAGAIVSAVALGQFGRRLNKGWLLVFGLVATGITLIALGSVPLAMRDVVSLRGFVREFGAGFACLLGLEFGVLLIPALTYLMEHTEDHVRGRVFALLFMVVNGVTAIPVLLAAALSDTFGIDHVIAALGLLVAVTGIGVAGAVRRVFAAAAP